MGRVTITTPKWNDMKTNKVLSANYQFKWSNLNKIEVLGKIKIKNILANLLTIYRFYYWSRIRDLHTLSAQISY